MNEEKFSNDRNGAELTPLETDALLAKVEHILEQMLLLAEVSASDNLDVDREALQRTMKRLQVRLDQVADELGRTRGNPQ